MSPADERSPAVLVIEDDTWVRSLLTDLLPSEGFAVEEASNGPSGIRLAKEHQPDVILLDLAMPEMSGVDVLRELKSDTATEEVPVIVVSAYTAQMPIDDERLADGVIQKPFDVADLLDQVERVRALRARSTSRLHTV